MREDISWLQARKGLEHIVDIALRRREWLQGGLRLGRGYHALHCIDRSSVSVVCSSLSLSLEK